MKSLLLIMFLSGMVVAQAQTFSDPASYNNAIVEEQNRITARNLDYITTSVHSKNFQLIDQKRQEVIKQLQSALAKTKALPDYNGDTQMRDKAAGVLQTYLETFEIDFNDALALKMDSEASFEAMEAYFLAQEKAEKKLDQANQTFMDAQMAFAKSNNMEIVGNPKAESKLTLIGNLNQYTREVYLQYFKVSKINAAYMEALNVEDLDKMKTKTKALQKASAEALKALNAMDGFEGDKTYLNSAIKLALFHDELAQEDYPELNKIISRKDKLTQEDVDAFNKIIDKVNSGSQSLIERFNSESENILKKHIPAPGKRT